MKVLYRKLLKEPLIQFLLIGLALFFCERWINQKDYSDDQFRILVNDQIIAQFMQQQVKKFDPLKAQQQVELLSDVQRQRLVDDYVRGETLYREAKALNLDRDDQIIRRRLMQKMDYLAQGFYDDIDAVTENDLTTYYNLNQQDYKKPSRITFTHVYVAFDQKKHDSEASAALEAGEILKILRENNIPFEQSGLYGQRFLYNRNYVNRDVDEISSHFGQAFKQQIFDLEFERPQWQGPIKSSYGWHLILMTHKEQAYIPPLSEIGSIVLADVQRQRQQKVKRQAIQKLQSKYEIIDRDQRQ
ncbi:MAG: peptidylprolyl isomerase [Porticoccaceae bacterium]|nr:peptidylprolyl isomerase [Porticoccaceae bacterium]MDG1473413.1 peptidylprolyl isomerase [Porticoccaceae bacterium]